MTGSFIPERETLEDGFDYDDTPFDDLDDSTSQHFADEEASGDAAQDWNHRSNKKRALWADPERRKAMLAKRRATTAAKQAPLTTPPEPFKAEMSPGATKRAEALRLRFADEATWMDNRLAAGAEKRARLNNNEYKAERQRQRQKVARRRSEARRKAMVEGLPRNITDIPSSHTQN